MRVCRFLVPWTVYARRLPPRRSGSGPAGCGGKKPKPRQRSGSCCGIASWLAASSGARYRSAVNVADFYCHQRKLIVELDGGIHSEPDQQLHDRNRDTFLLSLGLRILRFSNEEALDIPQKVLDQIRTALISR